MDAKVEWEIMTGFLTVGFLLGSSYSPQDGLGGLVQVVWTDLFLNSPMRGQSNPLHNGIVVICTTLFSSYPWLRDCNILKGHFLIPGIYLLRGVHTPGAAWGLQTFLTLVSGISFRGSDTSVKYEARIMILESIDYSCGSRILHAIPKGSNLTDPNVYLIPRFQPLWRRLATTSP